MKPAQTDQQMIQMAKMARYNALMSTKGNGQASFEARRQFLAAQMVLNNGNPFPARVPAAPATPVREMKVGDRIVDKRKPAKVHGVVTAIKGSKITFEDGYRTYKRHRNQVRHAI